MRFVVVVVSACAFTAPAVADVGVGAVVGNEEAILIPIRLSSVIIEPYLGYREADVGPTSTEGQTVGVGVFGSSMRGDNVSIYYGARLADINDESSSTLVDPITGLPIAQSRSDIDGYRIAPTVGFQYTISRVAIGAEIGWAYEEVDQSVSFGGPSTERTTEAEGTFANVVFRFFF
jgi:hypothetical protein